MVSVAVETLSTIQFFQRYFWRGRDYKTTFSFFVVPPSLSIVRLHLNFLTFLPVKLLKTRKRPQDFIHTDFGRIVFSLFFWPKRFFLNFWPKEFPSNQNCGRIDQNILYDSANFLGRKVQRPTIVSFARSDRLTDSPMFTRPTDYI